MFGIALDATPEVRDAMEGSAADSLLRDQTKPSFDLLEPRSTGRCVIRMVARTASTRGQSDQGIPAASFKQSRAGQGIRGRSIRTGKYLHTIGPGPGIGDLLARLCQRVFDAEVRWIVMTGKPDSAGRPC